MSSRRIVVKEVQCTNASLQSQRLLCSHLVVTGTEGERYGIAHVFDQGQELVWPAPFCDIRPGSTLLMNSETGSLDAVVSPAKM